ncbi:MAG: YkgJ family cysteine cluster protein [Desulfobulbus sp.]|jgi:Fe-S-cluster containining protein
MNTDLPEYFQPTTADSPLRFACHAGVPCFTECCRELDLALTPYDVLRLKRRLGISSTRFLEDYVIIELISGQVFPLCYLTMVDDDRASCVFVAKQGCTVYTDRPSSCRTYPVGRGASWNRDDNTVRESLVLLREPHCRGFAESSPLVTVQQYLATQELEPYNRYNDALLPLLQHPLVQSGAFKPSRSQLDQYMLALYDLDRFRRDMNEGRIVLNRPLSPAQLKGLTGDDEELLLLAICWLREVLFGE